MALLSTHLNHERIAQIKQTGLSPVYVALDFDAWKHTIGYVKYFRSLLRMIPLRITKDFKNMTPTELEETLNVNRAAGL